MSHPSLRAEDILNTVYDLSHSKKLSEGTRKKITKSLRDNFWGLDLEAHPNTLHYKRHAAPQHDPTMMTSTYITLFVDGLMFIGLPEETIKEFGFDYVHAG